MSAFDLTWINLKKAWYDNEDFRGDPDDEEAHRRGEEEDHQNWLNDPKNQDDSPNERVDAPTLDSNHILRLTRPQLDKLMEDIQSEIQRRETKKANKNVAVVSNSPRDLSSDPSSPAGKDWIKNNSWAFDGG